jgi:hypothetical protein
MTEDASVIINEEHEIRTDDPALWVLGKTQIDSKLLKFFSVLGITLLTMVFCVVMIATNECGDQHIYVTVMTGLISYWMPSPGL